MIRTARHQGLCIASHSDSSGVSATLRADIGPISMDAIVVEVAWSGCYHWWAADDDPSGIATYSVAGAQLGTKLLGTALLTWPLMAAVQMTCARIGKVTGQGLAANFKRRFPRCLLFGFVTALLAANTIKYRSGPRGSARLCP